VQSIKSNDRVFVHGVAASPQQLIRAMTSRHKELKNVEIVHLHTEGKAEYADAKYTGSFKVNNLFVGANLRSAVQEGRAGYIPVFLSEVPLLFKRDILPLDAALIHVSPPDKHGYCSLGTSVDVAVTAVECAKTVIAQVNPQMPRTHGDGLIHISCIDSLVETNEPIFVREREIPSEIEQKIGKLVASLVPDGATLQMGIGSIPDAVLSELKGHKRLGIHTEMFSDGVIDLVERGFITNEEKKLYKNLMIVGFCMGTKRLYDFIDDNPLVHFLRIENINDPAIVKQNPKVIAINSAIEVDLTGQVVADSIGSKIYSGVGGQMDFMRGAALSEGGKPIIALPSTTSKGVSRIVQFLKPGGGVVTTRAHVHYVVTEYGIAYLYGKNLHQRAKELIKIAHPMHREALEKAVHHEFSDLW
jgi:acyl-CoA hydrolase